MKASRFTGMVALAGIFSITNALNENRTGGASQALWDPLVIEKILNHLDEKGTSANGSRRPPCRAPPQAGLFD